MKRAVIRLPNEVVDRLDRLAAEMRVAHPEESYSRASVVRALISTGLASISGVAPGVASGVASDGGSVGVALPAPQPLDEGAPDERLHEVARRAARTPGKRAAKRGPTKRRDGP